MDLEAVLTIAREITVTGLLVASIWGLLTGKVVTRFHYDEMKNTLEKRIGVQSEVIRRLKSGPGPE